MRIVYSWLLATSLFFLAPSIHAAPDSQTTSSQQERSGQLPPGTAIASAHRLATQAGLDMIRAGGNGFDAAVATSAMLAVVEPISSGIGGGGFFLLHDARTGKVGPVVVEAPAGLGIEAELAAEYEGLRTTFNSTYSALNAAAATTYWKAYPTALTAIPRLALDFDLYVASGVPQDLLEADLMRHGYDSGHFRGIWGANRQGGADKAELLGRIRSLGYLDVLFVGDATRDLEYAQAADVKFFRVEGADDSSVWRR